MNFDIIHQFYITHTMCARVNPVKTGGDGCQPMPQPSSKVRIENDL